MASKQNVVKPSSADVETICWLAARKAITSITPVGKTTMVYRLQYRGTFDINFSGISATRKGKNPPIYDIDLNISELKDKDLIMLSGCGFPIIFANKGPANKNPEGTIYRVKNTDTTVRELDDRYYCKLLVRIGRINAPAGKSAFIKQATADKMPDVYIRAVLKTKGN